MYGIKLRQLRRQLGLTQRQLGTLCGVGGTTISMIEHGKRLPGRETLRRLQAVLGDLPPRPAKPLPTAELLTLLRGISPCKGQDGPQASPSPAGDGFSGRSPLAPAKPGRAAAAAPPGLRPEPLPCRRLRRGAEKPHRGNPMELCQKPIFIPAGHHWRQAAAG